jgi:hypothetical protein
MATIPNVTAGDVIAESWGDAVADELNDNTVKKAPGTAQTITPTADVVPLIIKGKASQTAVLQEWRNNAGTLLASVDINGKLTIAGQIAFPATQNAAAGANVLDDYEEGTYTPTITAGTGTFTSASGAGAYTKVGNFVYVTIIVTITTNGTAAGDVRSTLPFTPSGAAGTPFGIGREMASTGAQLWAWTSGTTTLIATFANTYPGGSGSVPTVGMSYRTST